MRYMKDIITRIAIALILLLIPFNIFYFLFSKITLWSSLPFLYLLGYSINIQGFILLVNGQSLEFIPACVATSAYYLLTLLILLTKDVKFKTRVYLFLLGCSLIFLMNVIRIDILLYTLLRFGENWFDKLHIFFWHFVSSVYVAFLWIFLTYKFKIKSIPIYSDFKFLLKKSIFRKSKTSKKFKKSCAR